MRSCIISLVLMSICGAQGQNTYVESWSSSGAGRGDGQFPSHYGEHPVSRDSVQAVSRDPYSRSSSSRVTSSNGYNVNGTAYNRHTVENTIENTLYHYESLQWPSLNIVNEFRFKLDLSEPRSTPVWDHVPARNDIGVSQQGYTRTTQREGTGTNQRGYTGTNQWQGTGTNQRGYTGTNQWQGTGTNQRGYTGTNQWQGTGTNQRDYTGTNQRQGTGTNQWEYTSTNQREHTSQSPRYRYATRRNDE